MIPRPIGPRETWPKFDWTECRTLACRAWFALVGPEPEVAWLLPSSEGDSWILSVGTRRLAVMALPQDEALEHAEAIVRRCYPQAGAKPNAGRSLKLSNRR